MRRSIKKFFTISTIAFVILYPCLFMYFQNADEAKLIDALPAFEKFLALAIVVFIICIIFMKNTGKAVLASDVILFILTNFNVFLSKVDHVIGRKKIIVILFFIIFMFMILVKKKIRSEQNICMLIGIYFLVLIAMNFFVALPTICSKLNYQKVENSENIEYVSEEKPNVYFFICDEYAGVEGLH